jgi:hypothetical protein
VNHVYTCNTASEDVYITDILKLELLKQNHTIVKHIKKYSDI